MPEEVQHGSNDIGIAESRAHNRIDVHSLAYIELGDGNAGIVLNISETGLAVQTIQILGSDQFSQIAFRLPRTDTRIEVSGKVVWQIRSKKQAGIRFVEVPDIARAAIKSWMTAEQARRVDTADPIEPEVQSSGAEEAAREPERGVIDQTLTAPQSPLSAKPVDPVSAAPVPAVKAAPRAPSTTNGANPNAMLARPKMPARQPLRSGAGGSHVSLGLGSSGTVLAPFGYVPLAAALDLRKPRRWWTYTATIGVLAAIAFAELVTFDPDAITRARNAAQVHLQDTNASAQTADRTQPTAPRAQQSPTNGEGAANSTLGGTASGAQGTLPTVLPGDSDTPPASANSANALGSNSTSPSSGSVGSSRTATGQQPNDSASAGIGASGSTGEPAGAAPSDPEVEHKIPTADDEHSGAADGSERTSGAVNTRTRGQGHAAYAPTNNAYRRQNSAAPPLPNGSSNRETQTPVQRDQDAYAARRSVPGSQPANTRAVAQEPKSIDMPSAYSSPVAPSEPLRGIPSGSVAASSQFIGIRIPPELESQSAQLVGQVHLGQLLSSYSPAYPTDAARAGVEGTVNLSVVVGKDGTVKSVQALGGPAMLASVAAAAVRDWRYSETFLAGQPIETMQYVTIVFRLSKPAER